MGSRGVFQPVGKADAGNDCNLWWLLSLMLCPCLSCLMMVV
jgi:hypothetical protein